MEFEELRRIIQAGENDSVEFKRSTGQLSEVGKSLCGLLNFKGGMVLIGVGEKGEIQGQMVSDRTQQDISQLLNEITPLAPISYAFFDLPKTERRLIILKTDATFPAAVYHFRGKAYERSGSAVHPMKYERLRQLMLERAASSGWDRLPAKGYSIDDLDHEEIYRTVENGVACGRLSRTVVPKDDLKGILQGLKVMENGCLTNAAIVLFGKSLDSDFPQCELKMARFMGTDKVKGFLDEKRVTGHAFVQLREAEAFVRRHLNIRMEFDPNQLARIDTPQLPFLAVREALINAICHRDYAHPSGSISLALYEDRMELWNMGGLLPPLEFKDLQTPHQSILRNNRISSVFYVRKHIEQWGSGILRIGEWCRELGCPDPSYTQQTGGFSVEFKYKSFSEQEENRIILSDEIPLSNILPREKSILTALKKYPDGVSLRSLLTELPNISRATLKRDLAIMEKQNLVKKHGIKRGTHWVLCPK